MSSSQFAPLVSVIIPIYNAEAYLDQALESVEDKHTRTSKSSV